MSETTASRQARKAYLHRVKTGPCTRDPNNRLRCDGCGFIPHSKDRSRWEESMMKHFERVRSREMGEIPKRPPRPCPYCRRNVKDVRRHIKICHQRADMRFRCTKCGTSGFDLELDFVDHINEYCPVQKEQNALFGGWIWTETDPRIPVRKDVMHLMFPEVLAAAAQALKRTLTVATAAPSERVQHATRPLYPTLQYHQPPPPTLASQQPLPTNFQQVSANLPPLNDPQIATEHPFQGMSHSMDPVYRVWNPTAYPPPATNFAPPPTQMNLQQPFLPHGSFVPSALPSQQSQTFQPPSGNYYNPSLNQFYSPYMPSTTGHSLAKHLSPRQLHRYGSHLLP